MEKLKPCPFCGSAEVELHAMHFTVYCIACGAESARFVSDSGAINGWNRRVPEAAGGRVMGNYETGEITVIPYGWIPVSERVPQDDGWALCAHEVLGINGIVIRDKSVIRSWANDPQDRSMIDAYWMELPKAPAGGSPQEQP